jgi:hypothetical protein
MRAMGLDMANEATPTGTPAEKPGGGMLNGPRLAVGLKKTEPVEEEEGGTRMPTFRV